MMETREIQNELIRTGRELGMCDKFMGRLEAGPMSRQDMFGLFHAGLDFCIEHNWPSIDFINEAFTDLELSKAGIYKRGDCLSENQKNVVAIGNATVDVYVGNSGVTDIYCRHNSTINLHLGDNAFCYISVHDNGTVNVISKGAGARLCTSLFSGTINQQELFDKIHRK